MCVCVFALCIRMWDCTQKPFEVPHSLYTPLPHVSSLFEDHVAMIIKAALFPLQTYGMNMDMMWHRTFRRHPSLRSRPAAWWSLTGSAILNNLCGSWTCHSGPCLWVEARAIWSSNDISYPDWYGATEEHRSFFFSFYPPSLRCCSFLASSQVLCILSQLCKCFLNILCLFHPPTI